MKGFSRLLVAALVAAVAIAPAIARRPGEEVRVSELPQDHFELILSKTRFVSRDEAEEQLLLDAARLAVAHGKNRFVLLALPGEQRDAHPARPDAAFGRAYGHWRPHWTYYLDKEGWQWWHPEWGSEFWTKDVDPSAVRQFEVHAMIALGETVEENAVPFDARAILRDLGRPPGVAPMRDTH